MRAEAPRNPDAPKPSRKQRKNGRSSWKITVAAIPVTQYPQFMNDREHPFAGMTPEAREAAIVRFCGRLWADTLKRAVGRLDGGRLA